jgi:energy-converting hydrogenase Eha subunit A
MLILEYPNYVDGRSLQAPAQLPTLALERSVTRAKTQSASLPPPVVASGRSSVVIVF